MTQVSVFSSLHTDSWVVKEYDAFFNQDRTYQEIEQRIPEGTKERNEDRKGKIIAFPVLSGLHDYRRAT